MSRVSLCEEPIFRRHPTKCVVCEKQCAVYHHYNVPSCNGCKHFFRRTITSRQKYQCARSNNCNIVLSKCRACRIAKCFKVGMDEQLVQRKTSTAFDDVVDDEEGKQSAGSSNCLEVNEMPEFGCDFVVQKHLPISEREAEANALLASLLSVEKRKSRIRHSRHGIPLELLHRRRLTEFLQNSTPNLLIESEKYTAGPPLPITALEIEELKEGRNLNKHTPSYFLMDLYLAIEVARTLAVYEKIDIEDKETLIKHSTMMMHSFDQNFYACESSVDTIVLPNQSTPVLMSKKTEADKSRLFVETFDRLKRRVFCRLLMTIKKAKLSNEEFVLLRTIFFCNSTAPDLSKFGRNLLHADAERYTRALLFHLQSKLGALQGVQRLAELLLLAGPITLAAQAEREMFTFQELLMIGSQNEVTSSSKMPQFAESCLFGIMS